MVTRLNDGHVEGEAPYGARVISLSLETDEEFLQDMIAICGFLTILMMEHGTGESMKRITDRMNKRLLCLQGDQGPALVPSSGLRSG